MKRLLLIIALILLLPVVATAVLLNTTPPLHWAAGKLPEWTGGMVSVGSASGTLAGVIVLHDIRIRAGNDLISIARLEAAAEPSALLAGSVHLPRLRISQVDYLRQAVEVSEITDDDKPFDIPSLLSALRLPVTLDFPQVSLSNFNVCLSDDRNDNGNETGNNNGSDKPLCETWLEEVQLGLLWNDEAIDVEGLDGHSSESSARGDIRLGLEGANKVDVSLAAESSLRQPALAAKLELEGSLSEVLLDLKVSRLTPDKESGQTFGQTSGQSAGRTLIAINGSLRDLPDAARVNTDIALDSVSLAILNDWLSLDLPAETWSLQGKLGGTLDDARFEGNIDGSYAPLESIAGDVVLRWHEQRLRIQATDLAAQPLSASISTDTTLDFSAGFSWQGSAQIGQVKWPGTEALDIRAITANAHGDAKRLSARATATMLGKDSEPLELDGELAFDTLRFSATLTAPRIHAAPSLMLGKVNLQANGQPDDYHFESTGTAKPLATANNLPEAEWKISGDGKLQSLSANVQKMNWLAGELRGKVGINWQDAVRIEGRLSGQDIDVSPLAGLAGLDIDSKLSPAFDFRLLPGDSLLAEISKLELGGSYNGHGVNGRGGIAWRNGHIDANEFRIEIGEARLLLDSQTQATDTASPAFVKVEMIVPDLAVLLPGSNGRFTVDAEVDANLSALVASGKITANALRWQEWQLDAASLDLDLDLDMDKNLPIEPGDASDARSGNMSARLTGLQRAGTRIDEATLQLQGNPAAHDFELGISMAGHSTQLQGNGGFSEPGQWQGQLREWQITNDMNLPEWQLVSDGRIKVATGSLDIQTHCLESNTARACLGPVQYSANETHAEFEIANLPLATFGPILPGGIRINGSLDGKLEYKSDAKGLRGHANLSMSEGSIAERRFNTDGEPENEDLLASWNSGSLEARLQDRLLTANASLDLLETGKASARSRIKFPQDWPQAGATGDASLQGNIKIDIFDLSMLPVFFPQVREVHGQLQAGMQASGTLADPLLTGNLDFTNGTAELTPLGTTWQDIELHLQSDRNRLEGTGSISSDGGRLDIEISGESRGELLAAELAVRGENFLAMRMPEAVVRLSPDLRMHLADRHFEASGTVQVPLAKIRPRDLSSAVQPSDDQVIVNRQSGKERPFTYSARVTTELGKEVSFEGFGLDAQLEGRLTVSTRSGTPATGSGEVGITSGEYRIYGQELTIVRGKLIYTGQPLTNPGLDVRALRRISSDLTVGLNLRGTATQPQLDVFSDPPMSQDETLAYLISGGSIGEATSKERQQVDSASIALGLGAGKVLGQVGEQVGVDEIRFSQVGNREEASLILGKYLSPDLYVGYGIGLFDAVNSFRVNYQLSSNWTLEAISGIQSSADLIYTIER